MKRLPLLLLALALLALALITLGSGCPKPSADAPAVGQPPVVPTPAADAKKPAADAKAEKAADKIKIVAYINVTSGCQASTVELVNKLGMDYTDQVNLEIVNFGSPEGERRWRADGLECMAIVFDKGNGPSPALKFKGRDGKEKTVVFFMPAGFSWEHEDLEDAFKALKAGKLEILSEEEARKELDTKETSVTTSFKEEAGKGKVLIGDNVVMTVAADAGGVKALDRAKAAEKILEAWAMKPVHPSQVKAETKDGKQIVRVGEAAVIIVTAEDAKAAKARDAQTLASQWAGEIRKSIVKSVRE